MRQRVPVGGGGQGHAGHSGQPVSAPVEVVLAAAEASEKQHQQGQRERAEKSGQQHALQARLFVVAKPLLGELDELSVTRNFAADDIEGKPGFGSTDVKRRVFPNEGVIRAPFAFFFVLIGQAQPVDRDGGPIFQESQRDGQRLLARKIRSGRLLVEQVVHTIGVAALVDIHAPFLFPLRLKIACVPDGCGFPGFHSVIGRRRAIVLAQVLKLGRVEVGRKSGYAAPCRWILALAAQLPRGNLRSMFSRQPHAYKIAKRARMKREAQRHCDGCGEPEPARIPRWRERFKARLRRWRRFERRRGSGGIEQRRIGGETTMTPVRHHRDEQRQHHNARNERAAGLEIQALRLEQE